MLPALNLTIATRPKKGGGGGGDKYPYGMDEQRANEVLAIVSQLKGDEVLPLLLKVENNPRGLMSSVVGMFTVQGKKTDEQTLAAIRNQLNLILRNRKCPAAKKLQNVLDSAGIPQVVIHRVAWEEGKKYVDQPMPYWLTFDEGREVVPIEEPVETEEELADEDDEPGLQTQ